MKICFLLPINDISGGIFTVYEHAKRLARKGHQAVIAFEQRSSPLRITLYPGMELVRTTLLHDIAEREEFDAACATWWETAYSIKRIRAKCYCYFVQGFEERFYEPSEVSTRSLVRKTYEENFHLFTVTHALRRYLRDEFGRESTVVRNSVDVQSFERAIPRIPRNGSDRIRVLVEGCGPIPFKRIGLAFSVLSDVPEAETVYLDSGWWCERSWRIDHHFTRVPYDEVPGIYTSCDVLLKLSSEESFARPVLEMFASGGTAIVSAFQGHAEYIRHGGNALVVPIDDREAAVRALKQVIADRDLRVRLQAGARETCGEFSWDDSNAVLEADLQQALARHRRRRPLALLKARSTRVWHALSGIGVPWRSHTH
jgi:glycosyltransferase involved in cell wall biosynthesis